MVLGATAFGKQARSGLYARTYSPYRAPPRKRYMISALTHQGPGCHRLWGARRHDLSDSTPGGAGTSCGRVWVPRPSTSRLDPGCIPVPSTSEKALHDLRSHTSGASLPPPVRGRGANDAPTNSTPGGAGASCRRLRVPRPSPSRLDPGYTPVPSTSEKALHDLRSHTSGASPPPPVGGETACRRRRAPLMEQVRAVGGSGCNDLQQEG